MGMPRTVEALSLSDIATRFRVEFDNRANQIHNRTRGPFANLAHNFSGKKRCRLPSSA